MECSLCSWCCTTVCRSAISDFQLPCPRGRVCSFTGRSPSRCSSFSRDSPSPDRARTPWLASGGRARVRPSPGMADPPRVLAHAGVQPRRGVGRTAAARRSSTDAEIGRRLRFSDPGRVRRTDPQRPLLVDSDRSAAVPPLPVDGLCVAAVPASGVAPGDRCRRSVDRCPDASLGDRSDAGTPAAADGVPLRDGNRGRRDRFRRRTIATTAVGVAGAHRLHSDRGDHRRRGLGLERLSLLLDRPRGSRQPLDCCSQGLPLDGRDR